VRAATIAPLGFVRHSCSRKLVRLPNAECNEVAGFGIYQNFDVLKGNRIAGHFVDGSDSVYYVVLARERLFLVAHKLFLPIVGVLFPRFALSLFAHQIFWWILLILGRRSHPKFLQLFLRNLVNLEIISR
jgi:hypothetical protein